MGSSTSSPTTIDRKTQRDHYNNNNNNNQDTRTTWIASWLCWGTQLAACVTSMHYTLWYAYHNAPSAEVLGFRVGGWAGADPEDICVRLMRGTSSQHWLTNMDECLAQIQQNFYGCEGLLALTLLAYTTKRIIDAKPGLMPPTNTTTINLSPHQLFLQDELLIKHHFRQLQDHKPRDEHSHHVKNTTHEYHT